MRTSVGKGPARGGGDRASKQQVSLSEREVDSPPVISAQASPTLVIDQIIIGERHRRDLGDIDALARSIAELGLLHPIVVRPDGTLIAGERRLRAVKSLSWERVPVTVVDIAAVVRGEFAENAQRKDFLPSEIDAIRRTLEPVERAEAKGRMSDGAKGVETFHTLQGKARDKIGAIAGVSGRTVEKIAAVCEAAHNEPEKFGKLVADMDRTGRVNGVFKRLTVAKQAERIRAEPPPLPGNGPYRVACVDFPWPYEARQDDPSHRAARPYPTMSIEQICATRAWLPGLMHADSLLWLWCTNFQLIRYAAPVLDALGFKERSILT